MTDLDIVNGNGPGQFGWLSWGGSPSEATLVTSLSLPGNSTTTYVNADDPDDHQPSIGDWISSKPGVSNSRQVRDALDSLAHADIIIPVWDQVRGCGDKSAYRVSGFAAVRLLSYHLPQQNRITARFLGRVTCEQQNLPPAVNAGADHTMALSSSASLTGTVSDDGLPSGSTLAVSWSQVSGAGIATFRNTSTASTSATFSDPGTYVLRLTASDSLLTAFDDVVISVNRENQTPVADDQGVATDEDVPVNIALSGSDPDGDLISYVIVAQPSFGRLAGTPPNVVYTPKPDYHGLDVFTFRVSDGLLDSATATVTITNWPVNDAPLADAQSVATDEDTPLVIALSGSDIEGSPLAYTIVTTPTNGTLTGTPPNVVYAPATNSHGADCFTFLVNDGELDSAPAAISINVISVNDAPVVFAGPDQFISLPANTVTLTGVADDDFYFESHLLLTEWSVVDGPGTLTLGDSNAIVTTATFSAAGVYTLRLTAGDGFLGDYDEVVITVNAGPTVSAGADQTVTYLSGAMLDGSVTDDGIPTNSTPAITWSKVSGPGTVHFTDAQSTNTTASFSEGGVYVLRLTATDSAVEATDDVTVTVNKAPIVDAGSDLQVTVGQEITLNGVVTDDGLPANGTLSVGWTFVGGIGIVEIAAPNSPQTEVTFVEEGTYVLRLTASDSAATSFDEISIHVMPVNRAPLVDAGPKQIVTLPSAAGLHAVVTDDGQPAGVVPSVQWAKVGGPGTVLFGNVAAKDTTAAFSEAGTYVLRLSASDSLLTGFADVTVLVRTEAMNTPPVVDAGDSLVVGLTHSAILAGAVTDDGLPHGSAVSLVWSQVGGPGTVTFDEPSAASTRVAFTAPGSYVLRLFASDSHLSASDEVSVTVYPYNQPPVVQAGADQTITLPDPSVMSITTGSPTNAGTVLGLSLSGVDHWNNAIGQPGFGGVAHGRDDGPVITRNSVAVQNGIVYVAGGYTNAGTTFAKGLASWDGVQWRNYYDTNPIPTTVDEGGVSSGSTVGWLVYDCGSFPYCWEFFGCLDVRGPDIFVGASLFKDLGNLDGHKDMTARWDGARWRSWVFKQAGNQVHVIKATPEKVYLGGYFAVQPTNATSQTFTNLPWSYGVAAWDGTNWATFGSGIVDERDVPRSAPYPSGLNQYHAQVYALAAATNGDVYAAGTFTMQTPTGIANNIARWNGTEWEPLGGGITGGVVYANYLGFPVTNAPVVTGLALDVEGNLYAVGDFYEAGGMFVNRAAKWNGSAWEPLGTGTTASTLGANARVEAVLTHGRDVYIGGAFTHVGGIPASHVAKWNGTFWMPLGSGSTNGVRGTVNSLAADETGVYVAGEFNQAGGMPASCIAKWEFAPQPPRVAYLAGSVTDDGLPTGADLTATWSMVAGPGQTSFANSNSPVTTATFTQVGNYSLRLSADDTEFTTLDEINIHVVGNMPPAVDAGSDQSISLGGAVTLVGKVADDGLPLGTSVASAWSLARGPAQVSFDQPGRPATVARFTVPGTYVLRLTANDTQFNSEDDMRVIVLPSNTGPIVGVGVDQTVSWPSPAQLEGYAADWDGRPDNQLVHGWSQIDGPAQALFDNAGAEDPMVFFPQTGVYVFRFTASDSELSSFEDVTITVNPRTNSSIAVYAGPDQRVVGPTNLTLGAFLLGETATTNLQVQWFVDGPEAVTFNTRQSLTTTVTFTQPGSYVFRVDVTASGGFARDNIVVEVQPAPGVNQAPQVHAGPPRSVPLGTTVPLAGVVSDDGLPAGSSLASQWRVVSGTGAVSFANSNAPQTTVVFATAGTFELELSATDSELACSNRVTFSVFDPAGNRPPVVSAGPAQTLVYTNWFSLAGTVTDDDLPTAYVYHRWSQISGPSVAQIHDPTDLNPAVSLTAPGNYIFQLTADDGEYTNSARVLVTATGAASTPAVNLPPVVDAGPPLNVLLPTNSIGLQGHVSDDGLPVGSTVSAQWSVDYASGPVTFSDVNSLNPTVTFDDAGTRDYSYYSFVLEVTDGEHTSFTSVEVMLAQPYQLGLHPPPAVDAGPDLSVTLPTVPRLQGSASSDSEWSLVRGPAPVTFVDPWTPDSHVIFNQPGVYVLRLVAFDWFDNYDAVTITVDSDQPTVPGGNQAPVVDAGGPQTVLLSQPTPALNGLVVDDGLPSNGVPGSTWSLVSGPGTVTFGDASQPVTTATFSTNGVYVLRLIGTDSVLSATNNAVITVVLPSAPAQAPPLVDAGTNMIVTLPADVVLRGVATDDGAPVGALQYYWSFLSGPVQPEMSDEHATHLTVHFTAPGVYGYRLQASDYSMWNADDVFITVLSPANQAPFVYAGAAQTIAQGEGAWLSGMMGDDGVPMGGLFTASWSMFSGPGDVAFSQLTNAPPVPSAHARFSAPGEYVLSLIATDSMLSRTSLVSITVIDLDTHGNLAPLVSAGPDRSGTTLRALPLQGTVIDDGLPTGSSVASLWSLVSGPNEVRFSEPDQTNATASFYVAGTYVLNLTANDGQLTAADTVTITINDPTNEAPAVFAGGEVTVTRPNGADLQGMVFDDELPVGYPLTYRWSKSSGPGTVTFVSSGMTNLDSTAWLDVEFFDAAALATFSTDGTFVLRLEATDAQYTNVDEVVVRVLPGVNSAPVVDAGVDFAIALPDPAVLLPAISDDGLPGGRVQVNCSQVSGPGGIAFSTLNGAYRATFQSAGNYVLRVTASDGELTSSDDVAVTVYNAAAPVAQIATPEDAAIVTAPTSIMGTASSPILQSYTVQYRLKGPDELEPAAWSTLETGTAAVVDNALATFDPTLLLNGIYELRLTATDTLGRSSVSPIQTLIVDRNLKIGHFTISFSDLTVPVAGLPIQVTRTYDSRAAAAGIQGDFGVGWSLDIRNVRLQKNRSLSANWEEFTSGSPYDLSLAYHLDPGGPRIVTITFPDGRVEKFRLDPAPMDQALFPIHYPRWRFVPLGNTRGTLVPASYDEPDGEFLCFTGSIPGMADLFDLNAYYDWINLDLTDAELMRHPTLFRYTTPEGCRYVIDEVAGLQSMTDPNGNTLLIGTNSLTWTNAASSGASLSIAFQRDALGRITNIVDAAGHAMSYRYSTNGNLVAVTDRVGQTNGFAYTDASFIHHLTGMVDGRGTNALQNQFDGSGRIVATTDAAGNTTFFNNDPATYRQTVTNRLGYATISEYDPLGRLIRKTDPVGLVTSYEYDDFDNLITVSNGACGCATHYTYDDHDNLTSGTDELGRTTRYTHTVLGKVLTYTDAEGNSTTNSYDSRGNLLSTRDPLGAVTSFTYNTLGRVTSMTDPRGGVSRFEYDSQGRLSNETNALGIGIHYTVDANGNLTGTSRRRTLEFTPPLAALYRASDKAMFCNSTNVVQYSTIVPTYSYDAAGHLVAVLLPDGVTVCSNSYNQIGQIEVSTDQLGQETRIEYNALGKPARIIYPDGTSESMQYDAEGQLTDHHDQGGRRTRFSYDPNGRVTQVTYPDGRTVNATYNLRGWLMEETDSWHGTTTYEYDVVGNRIAATDPLGHQTHYTYNARRACTSVTDALGRITTMEYDALNRNTRVIHPNGKTKTATYSGRLVTSLTDERGEASKFGYDAIGRLINTTNAAGDVMRYQYDELGSRVMETDAQGETTMHEYDDLGRRIRTSLPDGSAQQFGYDALGRLTAVTNSAGDATHYGYNARNSLVAITNALGEITSFSYNPLGQRTARQDPNGQITRWHYDLAGRLTGATCPDGSSETTEYDDCSRISAIVDRAGGRTTYGYNVLDQMVSMTDPLGQTTTFGYDDVGNLTSQQDPAGQITRFLYDSLNRQTGMVLPDGTTVGQTYDPRGRIASRTDPLGNTTQYAYDASGRLSAITDPLGHSTSHVYDARGNLTGVTDALGHSTTYVYDENNRLVQTLLADGSSVMTTYDARGLPVTRTDPLGHETHYGYDSLGRLVSTLNALGYGTTFSYDSLGRLTRRMDANGRTTAFHYDGVGNLTNTIYADGTSESSTYDAGGRLVAMTDANGHTTRYGYDFAGRLTSVTNALNEVTTHTYDSLGRRIQSVDALGHVTQFGYDAVGRLTNTTYPDGTFTVSLYDAAGRRSALVDEAGVTNRFGYDALGRLVAVTNALGDVTAYAYDAAGRLVSQTDANNHVTTYEYDALGRRIRRTLPGGEFETFAYDPAGNLISRVDFNGRLCAYEYDALNQPVRMAPDPAFAESPVTWNYDAVGMRTNMTDGSGSTAYRYDSRYRLVEKTRTWSDAGTAASLLYGHDAAGNVIHVTSSAPNGAAVGYAYDALNRLSAVADPHNGSNGYSYDPAGNIAALARPNGLRTVYAYDARHRATNITTMDGSLAVLSRYVYAYEPAGNRLGTTETVVAGGQQRTVNRAYTYDPLYRLTGEAVSGSLVSGTASYSYDAVGNRLTRASMLPGLPDQNFSYTANDQLTGDSYDPNGNTISAMVPDPYTGLPVSASDSYDHADRLVRRVTTLNSQAATIAYQYDGDGNRVGKTVGGVTTHFVVDELNPTGWPQVIEERTWNPSEPAFATPAVARIYTHGYAPLSQDQLMGSDWAATQFGHDAHGSVRYLTDGSGQVTDTLDYDAFGSVIAHAGTTPVTRLFSGEEGDADLGLYNLRARYHNPATGRFWTRDKFEGYLGSPASRHAYTYVQNNPVNWVDPGGNYALAQSVAVASIATQIGPMLNGLWTGLNRYTYGMAGGAAAGPDGRALLAANGAEGLFIQGLSQHAGINIGRDNFFAAMQGAPFLLAANPFVFTLKNDCFRYQVIGFDSDAPIYGCPNRNPVFTFDYSNDPMFQFAEGLVDARGAARGVGRGARDLVVGAYDLAENVVGAAAYHQMSVVAPETAQTLFGPQADAMNQTVKGLVQLGWDAANGVAYKAVAPFDEEYAQAAYGENLDRLRLTLVHATGGEGIGAAERFTYTLTQIVLPGQLAKAAEAARLQKLARSGRGAAAAGAARLEAAVVREANAERLALQEGRAAQVSARARAADEVATSQQAATALRPGGACVVSTKQGYQFNMVENPGPLASQRGNPAAGFTGGRYNAITLAEDTILYRSGEAGTPLGQWFTRHPVSSVAEARIDLAIKPQWLDVKTGVLTGSSPIDTSFAIRIPRGTVIYEGPVAYQGGIYLGGGQSQIFIPSPWRIPGVKPVGSAPLH